MLPSSFRACPRPPNTLTLRLYQEQFSFTAYWTQDNLGFRLVACLIVVYHDSLS